MILTELGKYSGSDKSNFLNLSFSYHYCKETIEEIIHCCNVMNRISPSEQWTRDIRHNENLYQALKQLKRNRTDSVTHRANITRFELIKLMVNI